MIYCENFSLDDENWYRLEWEGIEFRKMDVLIALESIKTEEELLKLINETYPDCKVKMTFLEGYKHGTKNSKRNSKSSK